jgi:hypothetical protein
MRDRTHFLCLLGAERLSLRDVSIVWHVGNAEYSAGCKQPPAHARASGTDLCLYPGPADARTAEHRELIQLPWPRTRTMPAQDNAGPVHAALRCLSWDRSRGISTKLHYYKAPAEQMRSEHAAACRLTTRLHGRNTRPQAAVRYPERRRAVQVTRVLGEIAISRCPSGASARGRGSGYGPALWRREYWVGGAPAAYATETDDRMSVMRPFGNSTGRRCIHVWHVWNVR